MAPERFRTGQIGQSSDTYGLACVLYQCLTGELPFPGSTFEQVATAHLMNSPPKPSAHNPAVAMDKVISTGLAKDRSRMAPTSFSGGVMAGSGATHPPGSRHRGADRRETRRS
jgi:serine/threonine protein kinase